MAVDRGDLGLPDLSGLSEEERNQLVAVMQRAKDLKFKKKSIYEKVKDRMKSFKSTSLGKKGGAKLRKSSMVEEAATKATEAVTEFVWDEATRQPLEGQLYKYTNVMKGWQYRWFVLDPDSGRLEYFEKEEYKKQRPRASTHLAGAVISPSDEDSQTFTVNAANGEIYRLRALDAKERQHWVNRLRATAEHHTDTIAQNNPPLPKERPHTFGSHHSLISNKSGGSPDSTLQTGIVGTSVSSRKGTRALNGFGPRTSTADSPVVKAVRRGSGPRSLPAQSPVVKTVRRSQHKHGIPPQTPDALKNVRDMMSRIHTQDNNLVDRIEELPQSGHITSLDKELLLLKATSTATLTCLEQCLGILQQHQLHQQQSSHHSTGLPSGVTIEWLEPKPHKSSNLNAPASPTDSFTSANSMPNDRPAEPVKINHEDDMEDPEEYTDTELEGVEEHKSIILHLLSQLKLGMDLTKVVLPTFILEKRSLLEMFADCMAHPDLFVKITDAPDPESRMTAMVEWYLTSFHASRKGAVAKKPYNPIIGETFHCSWQFPQECQDTASGDVDPAIEAINGTPEPESGSTDTHLYYCAEQVSHHPPISACYFECPEKKMYMNLSVWTKSKFMGMSIGVVMVGKVILRLLEHDEEYVFTLPSAYARSILTVPWAELGDRITINCQKTGYSAHVIFHTKPFYGGKLHRVTSETKNAAGEIIHKVNGEWNGIMEITDAKGNTRQLDTSQLKTVRKRVRPLEMQGEYESRRLWKNVTEALKKGDIDTATQHKRYLEERQRQGERHRKESNTSFPTKYFHLEDDTWMYNTLLKSDQSEPTV